MPNLGQKLEDVPDTDLMRLRHVVVSEEGTWHDEDARKVFLSRIDSELEKRQQTNE